MVELGQLLRQAREARDLSLADVAEQTRIRQRYLAALESGDWDELPNEVVARGFLRTYAQHLGLDPDELLTQAEGKPMAVSDAVQMPENEAGSSTYTPIDLDFYETAPPPSRLLRRVLGWVLLLAVIVLLAYLLYQFALPVLLRQQGSDVRIPTATLPPAGTPDSTPVIVVGGDTPRPTFTPTPFPTKTASPPPSATPTVAPSPAATVTPTPATGIVLQVQITQLTWTRIVVDDQILVEEILEPGFDQVYAATNQISLRSGNAAGLILTLNGDELPPLGEPGEIVEYIWVIDDGQVVEVTATPGPTETATLPVSETAPVTGTPPLETMTVTPSATTVDLATATPTTIN